VMTTIVASLHLTQEVPLNSIEEDVHLLPVFCVHSLRGEVLDLLPFDVDRVKHAHALIK